MRDFLAESIKIAIAETLADFYHVHDRGDDDEYDALSDALCNAVDAFFKFPREDIEAPLRAEIERLREAMQAIIDIGNDDRAYMIASAALAPPALKDKP